MSARTTRRAFVGTGVALAAGVGVARLPGAVGRERKELAFDVSVLSSEGPAPAFGTLRPGHAPSGALSGTLRMRGSARSAGRLGITSVTTENGILSVHTLDLGGGSLVALGPDHGSTFPIASGTGIYAAARGNLTVRLAADAALALDVDLEL